MHGELLRIGPISFFKYGTALAMAFLIGTGLSSAQARRRRMETELIVELAIRLMLLSLVTGRMGYILPDLGYYLRHPSEILRISAGGLSYVPAFVAGMLYTRSYAERRGIRFEALLDVLAPGLAVGLIIGSLGAAEWQPEHGAVRAGRLLWAPSVVLFFTIEYVGCWYLASSRRRLPEGRRFCQVVAVDALARMLSSLWAWILYGEFLPHALSTAVSGALFVGALGKGRALSFCQRPRLETDVETSYMSRSRRRRLPVRQRAILAAVWLVGYVLLVILLGRSVTA
ncbi:MAG: prolipoprotein diacylglyceryl transferase [Firmicutes bacterium]|jgi:hypothetical protein|nr:prolipoprotein diacylglyceryl transferase [Bacillota bacterium]